MITSALTRSTTVYKVSSRDQNKCSVPLIVSDHRDVSVNHRVFLQHNLTRMRTPWLSFRFASTPTSFGGEGLSKDNDEAIRAERVD